MASFAKYLKKAADEAARKPAGERTGSDTGVRSAKSASVGEEKAEALMTEEELTAELERIENKYAVSDSGSAGGEVYERIEYDAPTDEELKSAAGTELSVWKDESLKAIEEDAEKRRAAAESAREENARTAAEAEAETEAEYADALRAFENDMIKRGLARSSVAAGGAAEIEESRASALTDARAAAAAENSRIEEELRDLEADRERALASFDIAYAAELAERMTEMAEERDRRLAEVIEYNNRLTEQERAETAEAAEGGTVRPGEVPDALRSAYNLEKYNAVRAYLSGMSADEARVRVRNDPVVRDSLSDYYYYKLYAEFGR